MKFGLFYTHQVPRPWDERSEHRVFKDTLDEIEFADHLGFDSMWIVEHHFLEEYSHASAPDMFLAAASQRTKRMRLGHGIVQMPLHDPVRVAERIATLDLLSDGRAEFGMGEGSGLTEMEPFGRHPSNKRQVWEDAVKCCVPMLYKDVWEYKGEFFNFPRRNVLPKPLQKPHPPLWLACTQMQTIRMAGQLGMGALAFRFISDEAAKAWVHAYYNEFTQNQEKLADYATNPNISLVQGFHCAKTDEEAQKQARTWTFFQFAGTFNLKRSLAGMPPLEPGSFSIWEEYEKWLLTPEGMQMSTVAAMVGSPNKIRKFLRQLQAWHVDQVIMVARSGKRTHEDIMASMELFAKEVMPEFHEAEREQQEWKQKVLKGELKLEEIDTDPFDQLSALAINPSDPKQVERAKKGDKLYGLEDAGPRRS